MNGSLQPRWPVVGTRQNISGEHMLVEPAAGYKPCKISIESMNVNNLRRQNLWNWATDEHDRTENSWHTVCLTRILQNVNRKKSIPISTDCQYERGCSLEDIYLLISTPLITTSLIYLHWYCSLLFAWAKPASAGAIWIASRYLSYRWSLSSKETSQTLNGRNITGYRNLRYKNIKHKSCTYRVC